MYKHATMVTVEDMVSSPEYTDDTIPVSSREHVDVHDYWFTHSQIIREEHLLIADECFIYHIIFTNNTGSSIQEVWRCQNR